MTYLVTTQSLDCSSPHRIHTLQNALIVHNSVEAKQAMQEMSIIEGSGRVLVYKCTDLTRHKVLYSLQLVQWQKQATVDFADMSDSDLIAHEIERQYNSLNRVTAKLDILAQLKNSAAAKN